jgi:hypothetical protein
MWSDTSTGFCVVPSLEAVLEWESVYAAPPWPLVRLLLLLCSRADPVLDLGMLAILRIASN